MPKPEYFGFDKDYWKRAEKETRMKGFEDEEISKQHDTKYFDMATNFWSKIKTIR